jgi:predicted ester cyclase
MSAEGSKAIIRRLFEDALNRRNVAVLDELIGPSLVVGDGLAEGPDGVRALVIWLHTVFADLEYRVEEVVADGNMIAAKLTATGIQKGEYLGHPATGKPVAYDEMLFARLVNGKIAEMRLVADRLTILEQIGAVPTG